MYVPELDPYPGYTPMRTELVDDAEYEELPGGEQICPERHANIFSSMSHECISSIFRNIETELHVWKTITIIRKIGNIWKSISLVMDGLPVTKEHILLHMT